MQSSSEQQIVLTCEECGEILVLFGTEEDWRSRYAVFACEYGHKLTLDGRTEKRSSPPLSSSPLAYPHVKKGVSFFRRYPKGVKISWGR